MPWRDPPRVDFDDRPEYQWPCWNVDMDFEDLFGELHERFNTAPMFLQDPDAFHHDVAEIARRCENKADFLAQLQERRDQRLAELKHILEEIALLLVCGHARKEDASHIHSFILLSRNASLDCLVRLCATFLDIKPERLDHPIYPWISRLKKLQEPTPDKLPDSPDSLPATQHPDSFPAHGSSVDAAHPTVSARSTPEPSQHQGLEESADTPETNDSSPQNSNTSHSSRSNKSLSMRATNGKRKRQSNADDGDGHGSVKRPRSEPHDSSPQTSNTSHPPRTLRSRSTRATNGKRKLRSGADAIDGRSGPAKHPPPTPHASDGAGCAMVDQVCPVHDDEQLVGKEQLPDGVPPPAASSIEDAASRDAITKSSGHIDSLIDDKDDEPPATKEHPKIQMLPPTASNTEEATLGDAITKPNGHNKHHNLRRRRRG